MTKRNKESEPVTREELEEQEGEELPDREVMSILPVLDPTDPPIIPAVTPADPPE
jgi:hypothetical protein